MKTRLHCLSLFGLVAAMYACACVEPISAAEEAPASGDSLRGTIHPIERETNALQWTGRALLTPPFWAWKIATWPAKWGARLYETSPTVRAVADVVGGGVQWGPMQVQGFANWGSGEGFTEAGLKGTSSTWPVAGWTFVSKSGYIDNDRNILELRLATSEDETARLFLRSLYESKAAQRFHGLGPESPSTKLFYDRRSYLAEAKLGILLASSFGLDVNGFYDRSDLDDTDADEVREGESFAATFPGLFDQAEESEYAGIGLRLTRDTRDGGAYSNHGTMLQLEGGWNESLFSSDSDYLHYGATWQSFLQLGSRSHRVLGLRIFARGIEADDAGRVPVTELERAGGRFGLRGYPEDRFADLYQAVLTAEYRYRLTMRIRGALFADWGNVAGSWSDLLDDPIDPSFGFGLLVGRRAPVGFYVAGSREGVQFSFGSENIFTLRSRRLR